MLKFADMRSLGQRTESVRPCARWACCAREWYRFCLPFLVTLLVLPRATFSEINHLEAAVRLLNQGQIAQAEAEARLALPNPTTRALALSMLGTIRLQQGQYEESATLLNQAVGLDRTPAGARTPHGDGYGLHGKPELGEKCLR